MDTDSLPAFRRTAHLPSSPMRYSAISHAAATLTEQQVIEAPVSGDPDFSPVIDLAGYEGVAILVSQLGGTGSVTTVQDSDSAASGFADTAHSVSMDVAGGERAKRIVIAARRVKRYVRLKCDFAGTPTAWCALNVKLGARNFEGPLAGSAWDASLS